MTIKIEKHLRRHGIIVYDVIVEIKGFFPVVQTFDEEELGKVNYELKEMAEKWGKEMEQNLINESKPKD